MSKRFSSCSTTTAAGPHQQSRGNFASTSIDAQHLPDRLRRTGLLRANSDTYHFDPREPALAGAAATLAQIYPAYRLAVVSLIYGRPSGSISDVS